MELNGKPTDTGASYEQLMEELTTVLKLMEDPATSLDSQLIHYEKGMKLCRQLEIRLKEAEEKILLINQQGEEVAFE